MAADASGDLTPGPALDGSVGARMGARIRERRQELGRTLGAVAANAELSVGYLSSIENGVKLPSLPVLARLSHALEMSLADMLRTSASSRLARGSLSDVPGLEPLNAIGSQLRIVRLTSPPRDSGSGPLTLDGGDVFVYLKRGRLRIDVDGTAFELGPGDALHGDRPKTMEWSVPGDEVATSIWAAALRRRAD